jgi:RNA polymerase sigma-70 factor (ECF subfamily)
VSQDNAEFAEFFAASWDPCLRAVAASTGNMTLAEDQTAEAFARAWASWHKVSHHPAPRAWVVHTALNAGASWWRRRSKETALTSNDIAAADSQGTGLDAAELTALRRLPARRREVIVLRVFLDRQAARHRAGNGPRSPITGHDSPSQRTRPRHDHGNQANNHEEIKR